MPYKDKATRDAYFKEWVKSHAAELKKYHKQWVKDHPDAVTNYARIGRIEIKIETLTHYGPEARLRCSWPGCDVIDVDMLTLDHVEDDGAEKRKQGQKTGHQCYRRLRTEGYPPGYQTLCCNHNQKKELLRRRDYVDVL